MEHGRGVRRNPQSSSIPTPPFNQALGTLNPLYHSGGTYSQNGVMDFSRYPISPLHLGKFQDSMEFQSWKVNFETEVCSKTSTSSSQNTVDQKKLREQKSIDGLVTSQSITGRKDFTDYDMLDAMIASALKRPFDKYIHFRKRVSVEEQRAQQYDRFSRGRQIAHMIYDHFRTIGAHEAVQGVSDLLRKRSEDDDVQDFDTRQ